MRILVDIQGIEAVGAAWTEQYTRRLDALRREAAEAREQHRVVLSRGTAFGALVQQRPEDARKALQKDVRISVQKIARTVVRPT